MSKINIITFLVICSYFKMFSNSNLFDVNNWSVEKENKLKNTILYIYNDGNSPINFYRAEILVDGLSSETISNVIWDFENYKNVFMLVKFYKDLKITNENEKVAAGELIFFPYKNRTFCYYAKRRESNNEYNKKTIVIDWYGIKEEEALNYYTPSPKAHYTGIINGRWHIIEQDDDKVKVTLEYYNDWETNLPMKFVHGIEKLQILINLETVVNYSKKILKK